jgi:hypothetical protein
VSYPEVGKHMVFDGRLLHGAPMVPPPLAPPPLYARTHSRGFTGCADTHGRRVWQALRAWGGGASSTALRVTFLVNVWLHYQPLAARRLPKKVQPPPRSCSPSFWRGERKEKWLGLGLGLVWGVFFVDPLCCSSHKMALVWR